MYEVKATVSLPIALAELDALDVLCDFSSLLVPEAVWFEVEHHAP